MRKKGIPTAKHAREVIAAFCEKTAPKFERWLTEIADGSFDDEGRCLVKPDPVAAAHVFIKLLEFHIPKLARTEVTGSDGDQLVVRIMKFTEPAGGQDAGD